MTHQTRRRRQYAIGLWILCGAFALRVAAQCAQRWGHVDWLPPFDAWQSGLLPYPALLSVQLLIIGTQIRLALAVTTDRTPRSRRSGTRWIGLGMLYFAAMAGRLVVGATVQRGHWWLDAPLPSAFHLVLAANAIVLGAFTLSATRPARTRA